MATSARKVVPKAADVGARLRRLRRERRLTQADLASQIGIQQSDLSRMEKGEYRVALDSLFKLLNVFDVKMADFFSEPASAPVARPLAHEDMQILHLVRKLSPEARQEAMDFLEFKVRREETDRRAREARRSESETG